MIGILSVVQWLKRRVKPKETTVDQPRPIAFIQHMTNYEMEERLKEAIFKAFIIGFIGGAVTAGGLIAAAFLV